MFFKKFLNVYIIDSTLKRALLLIKIISFGMRTHGYYTKCNTNVRREVNPGEEEGVAVWKGGYHAYTSKGMERHAPRKWGQGLRGNGSSGSAVFDGGFPRREKRGTVPREFLGWSRGGKGVEWNGMESSVVPVGRGGSAEGPRGPKIDNAIPRLPLSPSTRLAPALLSFLLLRFSCPLLRPSASLSLFLSLPSYEDTGEF